MMQIPANVSRSGRSASSTRAQATRTPSTKEVRPIDTEVTILYRARLTNIHSLCSQKRASDLRCKLKSSGTAIMVLPQFSQMS